MSGFFIDYFRYELTSVCKVFGEIVNGKLDHETKRVRCQESKAMEPPTTSPLSETTREQRVEPRQQQESVDQGHANRVEPSPIANRTDSVASPTPTQIDDEYWRAWCIEHLPDQPDDDTMDGSWMRDDSALP